MSSAHSVLLCAIDVYCRPGLLERLLQKYKSKPQGRRRHLPGITNSYIVIVIIIVLLAVVFTTVVSVVIIIAVRAGVYEGKKNEIKRTDFLFSPKTAG